MFVLLKWLFFIAVALGVAILLARLIFALPDRSKIEPSKAIPISAETRWGRFVADAAHEHPGKSGVLPLMTGHEALASRLLLVRDAEQSIDLQYYIWNSDESGKRLLRDLVAAAKRGVRVRLLLDDNGVKIDDTVLVGLNALENFEVRLFNPSTIRRPKLAGYTFNFMRMNRRMHNKAFIVDGAAAIVGGRNIGDEYFAIGDITHFHDLDVLAAGAIVKDTSDNFDDYWNSEAVYPVSLIIGQTAAPLPAWAIEVDAEGDASLNQSIAAGLERGERKLEWTDVIMVSDDPSKGLGETAPDKLMAPRLISVIGPVKKSLVLMSAYFVPGKQGVQFFQGVKQSGADVSILTNAYTATDVPMVHSGYAKYRKALLKSGIRLLEMKPQAGAERRQEELSFSGSSGSSLHAKTLSIDDNRIFIGSFNFDPRSLYLNCEMGFLIDSPTMARQMRESFETEIPLGSYQVSLADGDLRWSETDRDGTVTVHDKEPDLGIIDKIMIVVFGWLPIERLP